MRTVLLAIAVAMAPLPGVSADLRLVVRNPLDIALTDAPVTSGIPWPRGLLASPEQMRLVDRLDEELPLQVEVLARWTDGSIKWTLLDFQATVRNLSGTGDHNERSR